MANANYNIYDVGSYITSLQYGGTILFYPLLGSEDPNSVGQVWTVDDSWNNVTISCLFAAGAEPLYLTASSASEGEHIGSSGVISENSYWTMADDGSLQLINNGNPTNLFAVIDPDSGLLNLASSPRTKWKFSKTLQSAKGWEEHK